MSSKDDLPPVTQASTLNHYDFKLRRWREKWTELRSGTMYLFAHQRSKEVLDSFSVRGYAVQPVFGPGHLAGKRFAVQVTCDPPRKELPDGVLFAARTEKSKMEWIRDIALASFEATQEERDQRLKFEAEKQALAARVEARNRGDSASGSPSSPPTRLSPGRRSSSLIGGALLPNDVRHLADDFGSHDIELNAPRAADTLSEVFGLKPKNEAVSSESLRRKKPGLLLVADEDSGGGDSDEDKYAKPNSFSDEEDSFSDESESLDSVSSDTSDGGELNASIASKQSSGSLGGSPAISPKAGIKSQLSGGLGIRKNASAVKAALEEQRARMKRKKEAEKRQRKHRLFDYFTIVTKNNPSGKGSNSTGGMPKLSYRFPARDFDDFPFDFKMAIFACAPPTVATRFGQSRPCVHTSVMNRQADVCNIFVISLTYRLEPNTEDDSQVKPLHSPTQALCLLSQWPMFKFHETVLRHIYSILSDPTNDTCIESLLDNLQNTGVLPPLPARGMLDSRSLVKFVNEQGETVEPSRWKLPPVELRQLNESPALPYVDRQCFEYLFSCLCVDNVIFLLGHMLCNRSIIIVADHLALLAPVCEALCALIHPFDCTSIYIPYLPKSLFGLLSSPVNYMVGVLREDFADKSMKQQRPNLSCYVVWLGKDKILYYNEGEPPTAEPVEGQPTLPISLHEGLEKEMAQWVALTPKLSYHVLSKHLATNATLERKRSKAALAAAAAAQLGQTVPPSTTTVSPSAGLDTPSGSAPSTPHGHIASPGAKVPLEAEFPAPDPTFTLSDQTSLNCGKVRTAAVAAMKGLMFGITDPEIEQITTITLQGSPMRKQRSIREILSAAFTDEHLEFLCTFFEGQVWATFADTFLGPDGPLSSADVQTAKHFLNQLSFGFRNPYATASDVTNDERETKEIVVTVKSRGPQNPFLPPINEGTKKEVHFNYHHNIFPQKLPTYPRNPMDAAIRGGDTEAVAAYLRGEGGPNKFLRADPNECDLNSVSPLHLAAAFCFPDIAKLLLDAKAQPRQVLELHCEDPYRMPAKSNSLHFLAHCVRDEEPFAAKLIAKDEEERKARKPVLPSPVAAKGKLDNWLDGPPLPPKRTDASASEDDVSTDSEGDSADYTGSSASGSDSDGDRASSLGSQSEDETASTESEQEDAPVQRRPRAPSTAEAVAAAVALSGAGSDSSEEAPDVSLSIPTDLAEDEEDPDDTDNALALVRLLVGAKCSPVQKAVNGYTPLHVAAETGNSRVISALLRYSPEAVNLQNKLGWTPLHVAASQKNLAAVLALMEVPKIDLRLKLGNGMLPIHVAARAGCMPIVRVLVERDPSLVNAANPKDDRSPLHYCVDEGEENVLTVGLLLKHHADPNATTNIGDTPLGISTRKRLLEVSQLLIGAKANVNATEEDMKDSPLFSVVKTCDLVMLEALIEAKCDPTASDEYGKGALHVAARPSEGNIAPIINRLVQAKCDPDGACHMGWSPLFEATQYDTLAAITALGSAKANIDAFGPTMATALQSAVAKEDVGMIATLLAAKASPAVRTETGLTALHIASATGNVRCVQMILDQAEADGQTRMILDNSTNDHEETPLYVAAQYDHASVCEALLRAKADPSLKTHDGETSLWIAARHGHIRTSHILARAEPKCCVIKDEALFLTPFEVAHRFHYRSLSEWLLLAQDFGPLHFAADLRDVDAVRQLLASKADPDEKTESSKLSALDIAFEDDENKCWLAASAEIQILLNSASTNPRTIGKGESNSEAKVEQDSEDDATADFDDGDDDDDATEDFDNDDDDDDATEDFEGGGNASDDDDESTEDMQ